MNKIFAPFLPPWVETGLQPAFYDMESGTVLQQTARMYAKVQQLTRLFNELSEETKTTVEEYVAKFTELKDFVDDYFDNLDVQEEINKKLDEMAEDGTLTSLIEKYFNKRPLGSLTFSYLQRAVFSTSDEYEGHHHAYMQGSCLVNGNVIACLRNHQNADNYVRLVEINLRDGSIVRSRYLELNHGNSISYNEKQNKLYVASCAKMVDGVYTNDNDIFVVDYDTFSLLNTLQISNIPEGKRIRSVWYDNDTETLYAGDEHDMFILNENEETIVETIELDTEGLDLNATNQTLKKVGDYYYGLFISFLAVWDKDKKLIRVINIGDIQYGEYIGEVEDFNVDDNCNILLATSSYDSPRLSSINANFYTSNSTINSNTLVRLPGAITTPFSIYVNANSTADYEDGTSNKPFKSLQRAVNYALTQFKGCEIVISAGAYDYTYVRGVKNLAFAINGNVTIDGLEIMNSELSIYRNNSSYSLTVNGISVRYSKFKQDFAATINKFSRSGVLGADYNLYMYYAEADIPDCTFTGNNDHTLIRVNYGSNLSIRGCTFSNYNGYYAIEAMNNSIVSIYDLTLNKEISDSEHNFHLTTGSRMFSEAGSGLNAKNNYQVNDRSMHYPTLVNVEPEHHFFGDVCTVDDHYTHVLLHVKYPSSNTEYSNHLFRIVDLDKACINVQNISNSGIAYGMLEFSYDSDTKKLSITKNAKLWHNSSSGSDGYSENTSDEPGSPNAWCKVTLVSFLSL